MSLRRVELSAFELVSATESYKLAVDAVAGFKLSRDLSDFGADDVSKALGSGNIWVSRGARCRLDISVLLNGKPLESDNRVALLEALGYAIRDSQQWSLLLLSPSLEIHPRTSDEAKPHITVNLHRGTNSHVPQDQGSRAWAMEIIDVEPPIGVPRADFLGLKINFNVQCIDHPGSGKRRKTQHIDTEEHDEMLLDEPLFSLIPGGAPEDQAVMEIAVEELFVPSDKDHNGFAARSKVTMESEEAQTFTDLSISDKEMLLSAEHSNPQDHPDEMLFSQDAEDASFMNSQSSMAYSQTSVFSAPSTKHCKKRPEAQDGTPNETPLTSSILCDLAIPALAKLISGASRHGVRELHSAHPSHPSSNCISTMAPAIFSPYFSESMAHHARLLPTISHALSFSCSQTAQSPSLRNKLNRLAHLPASRATAKGGNPGEVGKNTRLDVVIQTRLWSMMQTGLFDTVATKQLWRKSGKGQNVTAEVDGFNVLGNAEDSEELLGPINDEDGLRNVEFLGLLEEESSDDGLLNYMESSERERLGVGRETDEMLFGNEWSEDEDKASREARSSACDTYTSSITLASPWQTDQLEKCSLAGWELCA